LNAFFEKGGQEKQRKRARKQSVFESATKRSGNVEDLSPFLGQEREAKMCKKTKKTKRTVIIKREKKIEKIRDLNVLSDRGDVSEKGNGSQSIKRRTRRVRSSYVSNVRTGSRKHPRRNSGKKRGRQTWRNGTFSDTAYRLKGGGKPPEKVRKGEIDIAV